MFEFNIKHKNTGELKIIFGYSASNAFKCYDLCPEDWIVLNDFYID